MIYIVCLIFRKIMKNQANYSNLIVIVINMLHHALRLELVIVSNSNNSSNNSNSSSSI